MREKIEASKLLGHLKEDGTLVCWDQEVQFYFAPLQTQIEGSIRFSNTVFLGRVDLSLKQIKGSVIFENCVFERSLDLSGTTIEGDLVIQSCRIAPRVAEDLVRSWRAVLDLHGAEIEGDVIVRGSIIEGRVLARNAHISGRLDLTETQLRNVTWAAYAPLLSLRQRQQGADANRLATESPNLFGELNLTGIVLGGDLRLGDPTRQPFAQRTLIDYHLTLRDARISGTVLIAGASIGSANFSGARIEGELLLWPSRLANDEDPVWTEIRHWMVLSCHVEGSTQFLGTTVDTLLLSAGGSYRGGLYFYASMDRVGAKPDNNPSADHDDPTKHEARPCRVGALVLRSTEIGVALDASGLAATGRCGWSRDEAGVCVLHCRVNGNVLFGDSQHFATYGAIIDPKFPLPSAVINGVLDLSHTHISGKLDLRGVAVSKSIRLVDARVESDVEVAPRVSKPTRLDGLQARASCESFDGEGLTCEQDVDLSGLDVVGRDPVETSSDKSALIRGQVHMPRATVRGRLQLGRGDTFAKTPHGVHLGEVRTGRLNLATSGLQGHPDKTGTRAPAQLRLFQARLGLIDITIGYHKGDPIWPNPVDLVGAEIESWRFGNEDSAKDWENLAKLIGSEKSGRFDRGSRAQMEAWLKSQGRDEDADAFYRGTKRGAYIFRQTRARHALPLQGTQRPLPSVPVQVLGHLAAMLLYPLWGVRSVARHLKHAAFDRLLGFGTQATRLLIPIIGLYAVSVLAIYQLPENLEPTTQYLAATVGAPEDGSVPPASWSAGDGAWLALRYHVPIVGIAAQDKYQPRENGRTYLATSSATCVPPEPRPQWRASAAHGNALRAWADRCRLSLPLSPMGWAILMTALNWIMWPLFLGFAFRRLLRQ